MELAPDRFGLSPVAAWGYDERVLSRLGTIQAGSSNLTAKAFRENATRAASAAGTAAAAVAMSSRLASIWTRDA